MKEDLGLSRSGSKSRGNDTGDNVVFSRCEITETTGLLEESNQVNQVKDRYLIVLFSFIIQGLAIMLPWNLIMTAKEYYIDYKLLPAGDADYRLNFFTYVGVASQVPNTAFNLFNLFCQGGGSGGGGRGGGSRLTFRTITSVILLVIFNVITLIVAVIDTSKVPVVFFVVTMVLIVLCNMCSGLWANCFFAISTHFPATYINAAVVGGNLSGLFSAIASFSSKSGKSPREAAVAYFVSAIIILLVALDIFLFLPYLPFFRNAYFEPEQHQNNRIEKYEPLPYRKTFKRIWTQLIDIGLHRFISMCIFPALMVDVKRIDPNFFIPEHLFTDINVYLITCGFGFATSLFVFVVKRPGTKYVIFLELLRFIFIPFFLMCNYQPEKRLVPVVFNDAWFLAGSTMFGILNGYLSGLTFVYAKSAAGPDATFQKTAGMMSSTAQSLGILFGHQFTLIVKVIFENIRL